MEMKKDHQNLKSKIPWCLLAVTGSGVGIDF